VLKNVARLAGMALALGNVTGCGAGANPSGTSNQPTPSAADLGQLGAGMFPFTSQYGYYLECTLSYIPPGTGVTQFDYRACPLTEPLRVRLTREQILLGGTRNPWKTRDLKLHPAPGGGRIRVLLSSERTAPTIKVDLRVRRQGASWLVDDIDRKGGLDVDPGPAPLPLEKVPETNRQPAPVAVPPSPALPSPPLPSPAPPTSKLLKVPAYLQAMELSCEEAALRMGLAWENIAVTDPQVLDLIGVDAATATTDAAGNLRWGDPYVHFVGNPNGSQVSLTGYGTYYPTIGAAAVHFGGKVLRQGQAIPASVLYEQVLLGHPAVVWVTYQWATPSPSFYVAFDGRPIPYAGPVEHAVTLVGVRPDSVWINNPLTGLERISKPVFEAAYRVYADMAVVLD
jgi:uncharacterized protein YvpB